MSAMRMTGAIPLLIAEHCDRLQGREDDEGIANQVALDLAKADGVIVMGNDADIDPGDYDESFVHPKTNSEKSTPEGRIRAAYEYKLIEETLKAKLPCFAVCGGMQRLNVLLGGSLHQHVSELSSATYHHQGTMGIAPFIPVQYIEVLPGTKLAQISKEVGGLFAPQQDDLPDGVFMENSFHHQAVNKIGNGLIPCAYTLDAGITGTKIIQALEPDPNGPYSDQFLIAVQWHPEFGASDVSVRSLQDFNEQVQNHARNNPKNLNMAEVLANSIMGEKWKSRRADAKAGAPPTVSGKQKKPGGKTR